MLVKKFIIFFDTKIYSINISNIFILYIKTFFKVNYYLYIYKSNVYLLMPAVTSPQDLNALLSPEGLEDFDINSMVVSAGA